MKKHLKGFSFLFCLLFLFHGIFFNDVLAKNSTTNVINMPYYKANTDGTISLINGNKSKSITNKHSKKINKKLFSKVKGQEIIEKRDLYSKHFKNDDGTITAYISGAPLHYKVGGSYEDIDLSITSDSINGYEYSNIKNSVKSYFNSAKNLDKNIFSRFERENSKGVTRWVEYMLEDATPISEEVVDNTITYQEVFPNVDLEYIVTPDKLKENIIVKSASEKFNYTFYLNMSGVSAEKRKDGGINFLDIDTGEVLWEIAQPMAEDSSEEKNTTYNVEYNIDKVKVDGIEYTRIILSLNDSEFLYKAKYPITIDPTTTLIRSYGKYIANFDNFDLPDTFHGYAFPGFPYLNNLKDEFRVLLKFDISSIPSNVVVNSAKLNIIPAGVLGTGVNSGSFLVKRLLTDPTYTTWNTQSTTESNQSSLYTSGMETKIWDLTAMISETRTYNLPFYGVSIQAYPAHNYVFFYDFNNYPTLSITYEQNSSPTLNVNTPTINTLYNEFDISVTPQVTVSDPNNDLLNLAYYIDSETNPRDTKTITNTVTTQTVSFNTLDIGSLLEGVHTLTFTAKDKQLTIQKKINIYVDKSVPVLGTVGSTSTDTSITVSGLATDAVGLHQEPYRYSIGPNSSTWTANTSYSQGTLTPNTAYETNFEARDSVGHIASQKQTLYTKAQTPNFTINTPNETTLDLLFDDQNPSTTQVQIKAGSQYVSSTGTLTSSPVWITPTNKRITVRSLIPNTAYSFSAKARNQEGSETLFSTSVTGTTLASPPIVTTSATQTSITVEWQGISGATGYDIEVDGIEINNGTKTKYLHEGLMPNTQHQYRVRTHNNAGVGSWSSLFTTYTLPDPPAIPMNIEASTTQTEITLTWDGVAKAESYDVEVDGKIINNESRTAFQHTGLTPLTDHQYRVRAKNSGGVSDWSTLIQIKTLPNPPITPKDFNTQLTKSSCLLTWKQVEGTTGYEIEVDGQILDNGAMTSYLHQSLEPLSGHTYRVRAFNSGGKSSWSTPIDITTYPAEPDIPSNIMTTSDETSITVMWYKVDQAENYEVEIDGATIIQVPDSQYVHSNLESNTTHTYKVRAKNVSGYSEWSKPVSMTTLPSGSSTDISLTNIVAMVTNQLITISWDTVAYEAEYEIEVDGVLLDNGKETIFNHGGLKSNELHTYKIRVKNVGSSENWVAILSLSTLPDAPNAPSSLEAYPTHNSIELKWDKVMGATGYDLEIDGQTTELADLDTYTHSELASGTSHTYRIRAKNETGVTAWSPAITKSTTSPTYVVIAAKNQTFDLSLLAINVKDFSEYSFVVTYNPNELEVVDLYDFTPVKDLISEGKINGSNLQVTYVPGKIIFKVNQNIVPGTLWTGEITSILFRSKISGQATIDLSVK